jgi:hypothetical protein
MNEAGVAVIRSPCGNDLLGQSSAVNACRIVIRPWVCISERR